MNRHRVAVALTVSLVCAGPAPAQPPERDASPPAQLSAAVRASITPEGLERQAAAIVRHERPSGSAGERAAIDHVVETLRADGVDVEVHTYQAYASTPISASLDVVGSPFSPDAITYSFSAPADGLEAELIDGGAVRDIPALEPGTGERLVLAGDIDAPGTARSRYPDVTGAIVLVDGNPARASLDRLAMLGAVGVVYAHLDERLNDLIVTSTWGTPSLRSYHRLPTIPAVHVRRSHGDALRARLEQGETRVRMTAEVDVGWRPHHLAVARIPAPDPDAPFVLFGGHIDSWYFGGTDEGASQRGHGRAGPGLPREPAESSTRPRRGVVAGAQQRPLRRLDLVRRPLLRRAADPGRRLPQHRRHGPDRGPPLRRHHERRPGRPRRRRRGRAHRGGRRAVAAGAQLGPVVQRRGPPAAAAQSPAAGGGRRVLVVAHAGRHVRQDRLRQS